MNENQWQVIYEVADPINAEIVRGFLESQNIQVHLSREGAGRAYGLTIGPLGIVQILVPTQDVERAKQLIAEYEGRENE